MDGEIDFQKEKFVIHTGGAQYLKKIRKQAINFMLWELLLMRPVCI